MLLQHWKATKLNEFGLRPENPINCFSFLFFCQLISSPLVALNFLIIKNICQITLLRPLCLRYPNFWFEFNVNEHRQSGLADECLTNLNLGTFLKSGKLQLVGNVAFILSTIWVSNLYNFNVNGECRAKYSFKDLIWWLKVNFCSTFYWI